MQNDNYYKNLLIEYYQADTVYLKKKYKLSFKEIFYLLEKQEKDILKLQSIVLELTSKGETKKLIKCFNNRKHPTQSFRGFQTNLFAVDTSKPIDKNLYKTCCEVLSKLKIGVRKWKQLRIIF